MNIPEYYSLLTHRGWSPQRIGDHLADTWTRTLIDPAIWAPFTSGHSRSATSSPQPMYRAAL